MAKSSALGLAMLSLVLVMSPIMVRSNSLKVIVLYATLVIGGPDGNAVLVAGPGSGPPTNAFAFGAVNIYDLPLRQTINGDSPAVGRLQGFCVVSSIDSTQSYFSNSAIIERGKYKVGTFQDQGILKIQVSGFTTGELGVPSGTGSYRFAFGYMDVQTVQQFPARNTTILQVKISYKERD